MQNEDARVERAWSRLAWALWFGYLVYYLYLAFGLPMGKVVNGLLDDSFYYLEVAKHIAAGHGSTFDGVEPTNGYHPLWMLCLIPIYAVLGEHPDAAVRVALLLAGAFGLASLLLLRSLLRRVASGWAVSIAYLLWSWPRFFGLSQNLLESSLLLFLYLAFLRAALARSLKRRPIVLGALLGLIALARLDNVFLLLVLGLLGLIEAWQGRDLLSPEPGSRGEGRGPAMRALFLMFGTTTLLLLPYLAWNLATFGHLVPISGAMKSSFPSIHPTWSYLWDFPEFSLLFAVCALLALLLLRPRAPLLRLLGLYGLTALAHLAYTVLFMVWGVDRWHFALLTPIALLALPWAGDWVARRFLPSTASRALLVAAGLWLVVAVQTTALALRSGRWLATTREIALESRTSLPPDAVIGTTDAGVFGYWSDRVTVNLDGLINNYRYRDMLRAGKLREYLDERHVGYILDQNHVGSPAYLSGRYKVRPFRIWYRPENRVAGEVELYREDEVRRVPVATRTKLGSIKTEPNVILLWRYRPERQGPHS